MILIIILDNVKPMTNEEMNQMAIDESKRKTHYLIYPEKRGTGMDATGKRDNGDILTWKKEGRIVNVENTFKKKKGFDVKNKQLEGTVSRVPVVKGKERRDFVGNGNIIGWC